MNEVVSHITQGIEVAVSTKYMQDYSSPDQMHFVFGYKVKITNKSAYAIQLLTRHWEIFDSCGEIREVDGDGVVGQRPVLEPGESHEYTSGCNLKSSMGKMDGHYEFVRLTDRSILHVIIPEFNLIAPYLLN